MPIDRKRILTIVGYNRGYVRDVESYFRHKLAVLHRWLYWNLERAGLGDTARILRALTSEGRYAWLRENGPDLPEPARGYARGIIIETDVHARVEELELYITPRLEDGELLGAAIKLKETEIGFFRELASALRRYVPEYPEWADKVKGYLERMEKWLKELRAMVVLRLVRVKIRIYNEELVPEVTPRGTFQNWLDLDALMDPTTGKIKWDWWLTETEIEVAKLAAISYWRGGWMWMTPETTLWDFMPKHPVPDVPMGEERFVEEARRVGAPPVTYPKTKRAEQGAVLRTAARRSDKPVEDLDVEDLVWGISNVKPQEVTDVAGVYFERALKINAVRRRVEWYEHIGLWVDSDEWRALYPVCWETREEDLKKAREELRKEGLVE